MEFILHPVGVIYSPFRTKEEVVVRPVELHARWDSGGRARGVVRLPTERTLALSRPGRYSFDEALVLWERSGQRAPGPEGLYRLGRIYRGLAVERRDAAAAARAVDFFTRYLASDAVPPERADEVRRALAELAALEGAPR